MSEREASTAGEGESAPTLDAAELVGALTASVKRRLTLWCIRWLLGFTAIGVAVYVRPTLGWLWWAGALVAATSLAVIIVMYLMTVRRLGVAGRRIAEYERIVQLAEAEAARRGDAG